MEKAHFHQRFIAFIIDIIIVTSIASIVSLPFSNTENLQKLTEESSKVVDKYMEKEIDMKTYFTQSVNISYEMARENGTTTIVTLLITILYFIVLQFYLGGQTIGKRLLKIRVVNNSDGTLTMNNILIRSLIVNSILVDMIILMFAMIPNKNVYFYGVTTFEVVQYGVMIASIIMITSRKDGRAIHDLIANTKVVKEVAETTVLEKKEA